MKHGERKQYLNNVTFERLNNTIIFDQFKLKFMSRKMLYLCVFRGFAATVSLRYMFVHFSRILIIDVQHAPIFDAPRDSIRHCSVIVNKSEMVRPKAAGGVIRVSSTLSYSQLLWPQIRFFLAEAPTHRTYL